MSDDEMATGCPLSRRRFLQGVGGGVAASAVALAPGGSAIASADGLLSATESPVRSTNFGRMFPHLRSFAEPSPQLTEALLDFGRPGGPLDAMDDLAAGPAALITNPALSLNNPDNPTHTAGATFMGQFFDHDVTFDVSSTMGVPTDPRSSPNGRTPTLDLDSVYGGARSPHPNCSIPATEPS